MHVKKKRKTRISTPRQAPLSDTFLCDMRWVDSLKHAAYFDILELVVTCQPLASHLVLQSESFVNAWS